MNEYCTRCYICNTDVPITHTKLHNQGEKHQICLKIAEIALMRSRKQIRLNVQDYSDQDNEYYFCDPCSALIPMHEKALHEQSNLHGNSLSYQYALKKYFRIYKSKPTCRYHGNSSPQNTSQYNDETDYTNKSNYGDDSEASNTSDIERSSAPIDSVGEFSSNETNIDKKENLKISQKESTSERTRSVHKEINKLKETIHDQNSSSKELLNVLKEPTASKIKSQSKSQVIKDKASGEVKESADKLKETAAKTSDELKETAAKTSDELKETAAKTSDELKESADKKLDELKDSADKNVSEVESDIGKEVGKVLKKKKRSSIFIKKKNKKTNLPQPK